LIFFNVMCSDGEHGGNYLERASDVRAGFDSNQTLSCGTG